MKRTTNQLLSWILSISLFVGLCTPITMAAQKQYSDIRGHWAETAIDRWSDYGIISGYDGAFDPDGSITRAQMAAILSNTLGLNETAGNPFGDVPADAWYTPFVLRCYAAGVMAGDGVNANPDAVITREAAMTMICNAFGIAPAEDAYLSAFTDGGKVSHWAAPFVAALVQSGIVGGVGNDQLSPAGSMTRASVVTVVDNTVVQYINAPGTYELTRKDGLILVAAGDVTLTGKTAADILVTPAADGKGLTFDKAEVSGTITVQADDAAITSKDSKLPEIAMTGVGSAVTEKDPPKEVKPSTGGGFYDGSYTPSVPSGPANLSITENDQTVTSGTYQNVIVTDAVGDGEVTLKDLTIQGDLTIRGGGSNSINLENCTIGGKVIMAKESGKAPRLNLTNTPVSHVEIQKPAIIEAADASSPVTNVDAKAAVEVKGEKTQVETLTAQANVSISSGNIYKIEVPQNAPSLVHISVASEANLEELEVNAPASIASQGTVSGVTARANVTVTDGQVDRVIIPENTAPVQIKVDESATISDVTVNTSSVTIDNDGIVAAVSTDLDTKPHVEKKGNKKDEVSDADHKHNWGSKWTYYDEDYHCKKCSEGDHIWTKLHNWNKKAVTKEPTAFEEGEMTYTCSTCDGIKKELIPALLTSEEKELIQKAKELGLLTYLELSDLDKVNRLEMAKLLGGYMDWDMSLNIEQEFTDCQELTELERKLIAMSCQSGLLAGYDDGSFRPNTQITRAEMAVILAKLVYGSDVDPSQFADEDFFTDLPAWASGYVNLCAALSLLEPTQSNSDKFYPYEIVDKITAFQWILNIYLAANNWPPAEEYVWVEGIACTPYRNRELWMNARVLSEVDGTWRWFTDTIGYTVRNAPADFSSASDREVTEWIDSNQDGAPDKSNITGRIFKAYWRVPAFVDLSLSYVEQTYEPGKKFDIYNGQSEIVDTTGVGTSLRVDQATVFVDAENEASYVGCENVPDLKNKELAYVLNDNSVAEIVFIVDSVESVYHRWDNGKVTTNPTAFEEGEMTYTCRDCKGTKTEPIPAFWTPEQKDEVVKKAKELGLLTYLELSDLDKVNRLEMAKLLGGYLDWDMSLDIEQEFTDCQDLTELERKLIAMACQSGVMAGYDDGSFRPNTPITRAEMVVILAKLVYGSDVDPSTFESEDSFTDLPAWAKGYVNLCAALCLLEPTQSNSDKFYPNDILDKISALQWMLNTRMFGNSQETYLWVESTYRTAPAPHMALWMNARAMNGLLDTWSWCNATIRYTVKDAPANFSSASDREVTEWIDSDQDGEPDKSNIQGRIFKAHLLLGQPGTWSLSYVEQTCEPGKKFNIYNGQTEIMDVAGNGTSVRVDQETVFVDVENEVSYTGYENVPNLINVELAYVLKDDSIADIIFILDAPNPVAYIAQFGTKYDTDPENLQAQEFYTCLAYFADGSSGIYEVDVANSDGIQFSGQPTRDEVDQLNGTGTDMYKADGGMKGLYEVHVLDNGKLEIDSLTIDAADTAPSVFEDGVQLMRGVAALSDANHNIIQTNDGTCLYSNNKTVFFYVSGAYQEDSLEVRVVTGVKNIDPVTNVAAGADDPTIMGKDTVTADDPSDNIGTGIRQVFYTFDASSASNTTRAINSAMLIQGVIDAAKDTTVYYYNNGTYSITETENGFVVSYSIWDSQTGDAYEITCDNGGKYYTTAAEAKLAADTLGSGFYRMFSEGLIPKFTYAMDISDDAQDGYTKMDNVYYLLEDTVSYDESKDTLFSSMDFGIVISEDAAVVDLCNSGLDTISEIKYAVKQGEAVELTYTANTNLEVVTIFVTSYTPNTTTTPGTQN